MIESGESPRDLVALVVAQRGALRATGELFEPYRLIDASGRIVGPVAVYLRELQACGRSVTTQRSYGMVLLRWFRFLWAVEVSWDRVTRVEARDFSRWVQVALKPARPHWRRGGEQVPATGSVPVRALSTPNPVTGKASPGMVYAPTTAAHGETVLRSFYEFHLETGAGPMVNPFPLSRGRRGGRASAHHNPMEPFGNERGGLYRPKVVQRVPRQLPASSDAFVWLRLYQQQMLGLVPAGRDQPLWTTLRRPFRRLTYHAAYRMFARVNAGLGTNWSLHDLRHTAAYRMARDPQMPLTDVQWVLGHAQLTTTELYLSPLPEDVIASVVAFHERRGEQQPPAASPAPLYRPESLSVLFGTDL
ncbi:MAG: tyrosine-type recombinase/integrase [Pseudonocardiaceae bacterium]